MQKPPSRATREPPVKQLRQIRATQQCGRQPEIAGEQPHLLVQTQLGQVLVQQLGLRQGPPP